VPKPRTEHPAVPKPLDQCTPLKCQGLSRILATGVHTSRRAGLDRPILIVVGPQESIDQRFRAPQAPHSPQMDLLTVWKLPQGSRAGSRPSVVCRLHRISRSSRVSHAECVSLAVPPGIAVSRIDIERHQLGHYVKRDKEVEEERAYFRFSTYRCRLGFVLTST
jgi:hypothetical protein